MSESSQTVHVKFSVNFKVDDSSSLLLFASKSFKPRHRLLQSLKYLITWRVDFSISTDVEKEIQSYYEV